MWQASQRFFDTIVKSHTVVSKAEVLIDGEVAFTIHGIETVDPNTGARAGTVSATVQVRRSFVRRTASATILDIDGLLTPSDAKDAFAVLRNEIRLYRGVQFFDATPLEVAAGTHVEYVPIFTGPIGRARIRYPQIELECYDRLWDLRGRFPRTYQIATGLNVMDQLENLLRSILPSARQDIALPDTDFLTALAVYDAQSDISTAAQELATACGMVLYQDPMGQIKAMPEPIADPNTVVWTYQAGTNSTMGDIDHDIDGTQAENAVLATNEVDGVAGPFSGYAEDSNPASLTYVGAVPRIVRFYSSPFLKSNAQCALAASTILQRELGVADTIVVPVFGNPAHESMDVVRVVSPRDHIDRIVIADEFDISTRAADTNQELACRTQVI
jgi:hypothetical protein